MRLSPIATLLAGALLAVPPLHAADMSAAGDGYPRVSGASMQPQTSQGQQQDAVKQVQQALNDQGYSAGPVDGIIGPRTNRALSNFQETQGLQASGQIDQDTLEALGLDPESAEFAAFVQGGRDSGMQEGGSYEEQGIMPREPEFHTGEDALPEQVQ